jgi:hypothetical protein
MSATFLLETSAALAAFGDFQTGPVRTLPALHQSRCHCPVCQSVVYSRSNPLCGVCGHSLPSELLFKPAEIRRISSTLSSEREKHRHWMKKRSNA